MKIEECIEKGLLKRIPKNIDKSRKSLDIARKSLEDAQRNRIYLS
jgi:hypothetical protein